MSLGVESQELQKEFVVKNFGATCSVKTAGTNDKDECRLILPVWHATHDQSFAIQLVWMSEKPLGGILRPNLSSWLGLKFTTVKQSVVKKTYGRLCINLVNNEPSKDIKKEFEAFISLYQGRTTGWFLQESFGCGLKLDDVFDASKGWLHAGALRLEARLQLATEGNTTADTAEAMLQPNLQMGVLRNWAGIFQSGQGSDVIIKVKNEEICAHSLDLQVQSKVFAAALSSPMREGLARQIIIDDLEPSVVQATLGFLYSGEIDEHFLKSNDNVLGVLETAHRYDISGLENMCVRLLSARFEVDLVAEWLYIADLIGNADFRSRCLNFIHEHIAEVQGTEGYAKYVLPRQALLARILSSMFPPTKRQRTELQEFE